MSVLPRCRRHFRLGKEVRRSASCEELRSSKMKKRNFSERGREGKNKKERNISKKKSVREMISLATSLLSFSASLRCCLGVFVPVSICRRAVCM